MKKNLWYLLLVVFSMNLFVACSDDDDPTPDPDPDPTPVEEVEWSDITGTYGSDYVQLNGSEAASGKTITLGGSSSSTAVITLVNIIPEAESVEFDGIEMTESGTTYTFSTEKQVNETLVSIAGTITPTYLLEESTSKGIDITVTRQITSGIAGDWTLNFTESGADFDIQTDSPVLMDIFSRLTPMVQGLLAARVEAVTLYLEEDGTFDFSWRTRGADADTNLADVMANIGGDMDLTPLMALLKIYYYTENSEVFYIALDKTLISTVGAMLPLFVEGLELEDILALMEDKGGYYALPINLKLEDNSAVFYLSKDQILKVAEIPFIQDLLPAEYAAMLPVITGAIETANQFDITMGFSK